MPESVLRTCRSQLVALDRAVLFENLYSITKVGAQQVESADQYITYALMSGQICVNK
jgi:hypothetical protein